MTPHAILCFTGLSIAIIQAIVHAPIIKRGAMTKEIKKAWTELRILIIGVTAVGLAYGTHDIRSCVIGAAASVFVFAAAFPILLNLRMGWHPFYLGSTSATDIRTIMWVSGRDEFWIRRNHQSEYRNNTFYKEGVHQAGVVSFAAYVLITVILWIIASH